MNHNYIVAFRRGFSNSYKKQIECQNWWLQWLISITLGSWWIYAVRPFKIRRIIVEFLFRFKTLLFLFLFPFLSVFFAKNYWKYGFFCVCHGYISKPLLLQIDIKPDWHNIVNIFTCTAAAASLIFKCISHLWFEREWANIRNESASTERRYLDTLFQVTCIKFVYGDIYVYVLFYPHYVLML